MVLNLVAASIAWKYSTTEYTIELRSATSAVSSFLCSPQIAFPTLLTTELLGLPPTDFAYHSCTKMNGWICL